MTFTVILFSAALLFFTVAGILELWLFTKSESGIFTRGYAGMAKLFRQLVWKVINKNIRRDNENPTDNDELNPTSSLCESSDCIRCSKNLDILSTALTRLSYYSINSKNKPYPEKNSEKDEYLHFVDDVKKSLENAKKDKDNLEDNFYFDSQEDKKLPPMSQRCVPELAQNPIVFYMSSLRAHEIWSFEDFPDLNILHNNWRKIALECLHLYQSPLPETKSLWKFNSTLNGKWEIAQLVDQGRITKAAEFCPLTSGFIKGISHFISDCYFGDASFSIVHPGTSIETHCGSTNCRIRCHVGLKIPQDVCTLQVGDKHCKWMEGEMLCFDDSFPHSVHHNGDIDSGYRAVFMIDLWHPDITLIQKEMIKYAFSP